MHASTEQIWENLNRPLLQFIRRRVPDEMVADDLLQDVYVKIHTRIDTLYDEARLQAWVYQIARNAIYDYYRSQRPTQEVSDDLVRPDDIEDAEDAEIKLARGLREMLRCLPDEYREALILTDLEGLTQQELAQRLGLSLSGAKSRVQRARKMLRDALLDCCHFQFDRYGKVIDYHPRCHCCANNECA